MRWLLIPIASLALVFASVGSSTAASKKIPSVLKGTASGVTVISSEPPYAPRVDTTRYSIEGMKLKLLAYGISNDNSSDRRAVYRVTAGKLTISNSTTGQCNYEYATSVNLLDFVEGRRADVLVGFDRRSGKSTIDTSINTAYAKGVPMTCTYNPGEPPVTTIEEISLPRLLQVVPFRGPGKLGKNVKIHYTNKSSKNGTALDIDWTLNLKGSKLVSKVRG